MPHTTDCAGTLRLLALRGRVISSRAGVIAAAARARRSGRSTYTLWPDQRRPMISADVAYPPAAEWLRRTLVPTLRRLPDAAGWMALRARAALVADDHGVAQQLAETVLGTRAPLRVAMFSPSGQAVSKAVCFLFHQGDEEPSIVVKAMAEPRFSARLRSEWSLLAAIRERVAGDAAVADALPPVPLFADDVAGEFVQAEPFDPLGAGVGSGSRDAALSWLRAFQAASFTRELPWGGDDERWAVDAVRDAWRLAGRAAAETVVTRQVALLAPLRGAVVPGCAVHGDFWHGNIAAAGAAVRVYDWEWSALEGLPVIDLWTYELADLRLRARAGEHALDEPLSRALRRVEDELRHRGIDERLARATLAPVLGDLSFRVRRRLAMPDEMERPSAAVIAAAERLLLSD